MDSATFREQIETALSHLRDVVLLRSMPLTAVLTPQAEPSERGWELARLLIATIGRLRPPDAPEDSWQALRYELLNLRYINSLHPQQVADELAMSRRHFYRLHRQALDELAEYLWAQVPTERRESSKPVQDKATLDERDLLDHESARLMSASPQSSLPDIIASALRVLAPLLAQRQISVERTIAPELPLVRANAELARELLLALLGRLLQSEQLRGIELAGLLSRNGVSLKITGNGPHALDETLLQLAHVQGMTIEATATDESTVFDLTLPLASTSAVLVVDDNIELGVLFKRYLSQGSYDCVIATTGVEAIALARSRKFCAVVLDLMMNHEDGWDVLQALRHMPETQDLPVIVCSVLAQADLAMMLGASAYLKKPVASEQLLGALAALRGA